MNIVAYLKARAGELSSILAASGATAVGVAYITGQLTAKQALAGATAAVVGYLWPETKTTLATLKVMPALLLVGALSACSAAQLAAVGATTAAVVTVANTVSSDECNVLTWGAPLVAGLDKSGLLDTNGQSVLANANSVLTAGCQNGDTTALARVPDLAKALVAILYPPAPVAATTAPAKS